MSGSDGVLAAIDAALWDHSVSADAMRWAPDEPDPTPADDAPDELAFLRHMRSALTSGWPILEPVSRPITVHQDGDRYWNPMEREWLIWPDGACPSCGRCTPDRMWQPLRDGEPIGPATYGYTCGYEERRWRNGGLEEVMLVQPDHGQPYETPDGRP